MAAPLTPTSSSVLIAPHLSPLIHAFTTPDLHPILARSNLTGGISSLLSAFETGVERVTVRSTSYEPRLLPRFAVHFVERQLPPGWGEEVGAGTIMSTRGRSGTVGSASGRSSVSGPSGGGGGLPHMPSAADPTPSPLIPHHPAPTTPQTPFSWPTQAERDELFLDSLSSNITSRVDGWIAQTGREELDVHGIKHKRRLPEEDEEREPEVERQEGWQGRPVESLTPWYAAMRDEIFKRREMVEWETFAWPVGCESSLAFSNARARADRAPALSHHQVSSLYQPRIPTHSTLWPHCGISPRRRSSLRLPHTLRGQAQRRTVDRTGRTPTSCATSCSYMTLELEEVKKGGKSTFQCAPYSFAALKLTSSMTFAALKSFTRRFARPTAFTPLFFLSFPLHRTPLSVNLALEVSQHSGTTPPCSPQLPPLLPTDL